MSGAPRIYKHTIEAVETVNQAPVKAHVYGNKREHAMFHYTEVNGEGDTELIYEYIHYNVLICRVTIVLLDDMKRQFMCELGSGGYSQTDRDNANSLLRALNVPKIKVHREGYMVGNTKCYRLCMRMDA